MKITYTKRFEKKFDEMPRKIQEKFEGKMEIFTKNQSDPVLKSHPLKGNLIGLRAFSVIGDYRVFYQIMGASEIKLVNIGTHNQVY